MSQTSNQHDPSSSSHHIEGAKVPGLMGERFVKPPEDTDGLDPLEKFMNQVDRIPEAVAAVIEGEHVTYQELNRRANQLSHWLQGQGVGPETIVGVCLDRSICLVLTILGVIKAGGCLVPLEPSYPLNRLTYMVEDCQPIMVLTQERYLDIFQKNGTRPICISTIENNLACESSQNPATPLRTGNLRVIFYTSGSTGQPKGVMEIYHKDMTPSTSDQEQDQAQDQSLKIVETDRMLVKCPMSFAPFLWELMSPLFAGGTAILASPGGEQDFSYLIKLIGNESVTVSHFVPSSLRVLLDQPNIQSCSSLASVCCSGEVLPDTIRELFFSSLHADIFLTYAATEAPGATWVHLHRDNFRQPLKLDQQKTTKVHVLDSRGNPVPIHQKGELYVEASQRVRGYFYQPGLTAEKFVPDPFRSTPGARLYRTGDLADHLPNGNFHVVGRKDQQVKIRGFRIECGEIETRLTGHPTVQEAAVLPQEDDLHNKRLVAYLVPKKGSELHPSDLRDYLSQSLPSYMIPWRIVSLDAFPLTPNGKVDRAKLSLNASQASTEEETYVAPRNLLEELLVKVWQEVIGLERIGIHDHFFDIGGQSLLATRVISRLRLALELDIPLRALFENPTVAQLANAIDTQLSNAFPDWPTDESANLPYSNY